MKLISETEQMHGTYGIMIKVDAANVKVLNATLIRASVRANSDDALTLVRLASIFVIPESFNRTGFSVQQH